MRRLLLASLFSVFLASCGGGGSSGGAAAQNNPPPAPPPGPTASELLEEKLEGLPLDEFMDVSYEDLTKRSPELVLWRALQAVFPIEGIKLDDLSDEYQRETYAMYAVVLRLLEEYDPQALNSQGFKGDSTAAAADDQQVDYEVYKWFLQDKVDEAEFIYYDFKATYSLFGLPRDMQQFFTDIHPLTSRQDAEDYIDRLELVSTKFIQLGDHLINARDAGIVEPLLTLQAAIGQVGAIAGGPGESSPFYTRIRDKLPDIPDLTDLERETLRIDALRATNQYVIPGYQVLLQIMQGLTSQASASVGVGQFPRGDEYYAYILKHHTSTNLTPAEVHQLGLDELDRIHNEMRLIFDQLGYPQDETLQELYARVEADGGVIPAADLRGMYEDLIDFADQNLPQAFDIFPMAKVVVADDDFGGYYIGPSFDGTRPGAFYAGTLNDEAYFRMPSLTFHESLPGHHMQIALAMESDARPLRKLIRITAFIEGWALYAERLAYELGWYDNDVYGNLGRLYFEALRAARLVIDTGIHAFGWGFAQATQFGEDNVGMSFGAAQGAAGRYSVIPGQATAYMIGMFQILDARQRAMDALGENFDLREFHRLILENGAMPMPVMQAVVDRYIEDKLAMP